jgi:hypothetical protein
MAPLPRTAEGKSPPAAARAAAALFLLAALFAPAGVPALELQFPVDEEEDEDVEDTGNWDTPPDTSEAWQPLLEPGKRSGIPLPGDSAQVAPAGILLPPSGGAPLDTLRPPTPAGKSPGGAIGPQRPASAEQKGGVLGLSPVAILAGLAVLHYAFVKMAQH